jgi:hypothetical protein
VVFFQVLLNDISSVGQVCDLIVPLLVLPVPLVSWLIVGGSTRVTLFNHHELQFGKAQHWFFSIYNYPMEPMLHPTGLISFYVELAVPSLFHTSLHKIRQLQTYFTYHPTNIHTYIHSFIPMDG